MQDIILNVKLHSVSFYTYYYIHIVFYNLPGAYTREGDRGTTLSSEI
jgi:hypothetical protein